MEAGKTKVRVLNEYGNKCAVGVYCGTGIPSADVKAERPTLKHYAVLVGGEMRYYPTGFHTLLPAQADE
jgi:hypothetical protein